MSAVAQRFATRATFVTLCIALLLLALLTAAYIRDGYATIRAAEHAAISQKQSLVLALGDVAFRDLPKAQAMLAGLWYADPHYVGEVHWYPFMQPMLAAGYRAATGEPLQTAYMFASMLISAAALPALALVCVAYAGPVGLLCVPIAVLAGIYWPNNTTFPGGAGELFLLVYLAAAVWLYRAAGNMAPQQRKPSATSNWQSPLQMPLLVLGAATGVLSLCHGASFVTACVISAGLLCLVLVRGWQRPGPTALAVGCFVLGGFLLSAPLIVPQVLHYGTLRQADEARLFLHPDYYGSGDALSSLLTLALLPRDWHTLAAGIFIVFGAFGVLPYRRSVIAPLAIGYLFALGWSHLGFVLHVTSHPQLARMAAALLIAPPHTLIAIWTLLANLMLLLLFAAFIRWLIFALFKHLARHDRTVLPMFLRAFAPSWVLTLLLLGSYTLLLLHMPTQISGEVATIPSDQETFFQQVTALTGPDQTVYVAAWGEQREFLRAAPFKVLLLHTPYHRNPYVTAERAQAEAALNSPLKHMVELDAILRTYHVGYALTLPGKAAPVVAICQGQRVLTSPSGVVLWRIQPPCVQR